MPNLKPKSTESKNLQCKSTDPKIATEVNLSTICNPSQPTPNSATQASRRQNLQPKPNNSKICNPSQPTSNPSQPTPTSNSVNQVSRRQNRESKPADAKICNTSRTIPKSAIQVNRPQNLQSKSIDSNSATQVNRFQNLQPWSTNPQTRKIATQVNRTQNLQRKSTDPNVSDLSQPSQKSTTQVNYSSVVIFCSFLFLPDGFCSRTPKRGKRK